ncbi:MAG TPA: hypothetical protein VF223_26445 [Trebonia sp.]
MSGQLPGGGIELPPAEIEALDETTPHMTPARRQALAGLLVRAHPGHRWLASL